MKLPVRRSSSPKALDPEQRYPLMSRFDFHGAVKEAAHKPLLAARAMAAVGLILASASGLAAMNARAETRAVADAAFEAELTASNLESQISALVGADLNEFAELEAQAIAAKAANETSTDVDALWTAINATIPAGVTPIGFTIEQSGDTPGERIASISARAGTAAQFYEWLTNLEADDTVALLPGDSGSSIEIDAEAIAITMTVTVPAGTYSQEN